MLKLTESDRLLVQIQAYLDNMFDVGALLEDAETKNAVLEHVEELQGHNSQVHTHTRTDNHTHTSYRCRVVFGCFSSAPDFRRVRERQWRKCLIWRSSSSRPQKKWSC